MMNNKDIVLLSTADWDNPFWTNKQHVAVELASLGNKVFYIDSLGLRAPSINKKDMSRAFKRIMKMFKAPRKVNDNIWVWSPVTLPWNKYAIIRLFNRLYLKSMIGFWTRYLGFKNKVLWTYNPLTTSLLDIKNYDYTVYHCVDEIKEQPGMPVKILEAAENKLIATVDIIFVTSPQLYLTRKNVNRNTFYHSNVADFNHFNSYLNVEIEKPEDLANLKGPILGFIGAISRYKIDFEMLSFIADQRPEYQIVLIGLVGEGDPNTNISLLEKYPNIHFLGPKAYKALPVYLKFFDVAMLPNVINSYTDNMFPMKFFEYLSAGKSVVSVNLNAIQEFKEYVYISNSKDDFLSNIDRVLSGDIIPLAKRLQLAMEFTYKSRTKKMLDLIERAGK
ncbi:glycosyltransferase [Klebsiella huaxiensis]|uniref:glycosyltransferase n=1 Tax=Klebsiella huaxiensis TaxID=2153354 RepID=UPI003160A364